MARMVDADELLKLKFKSASERMDLDVAYMGGWNDAIDAIIINAPTVDAVEVVRCKDCWCSSVIPEEMQHVGECLCDFWCAEMHEDDYCSCGKRREDG